MALHMDRLSRTVNPLERVGVCRRETARGLRFEAYIYVTERRRSRRVYIGTFDTLDEASHAYNKAAIELHGDHARLNPVGVVGQAD
ncbi:hypothetical protein BGLT_02288 [Caballeronia glathei]|nr:hypothetical protein BGLT_02288 [Caballeronia glathei]